MCVMEIAWLRDVLAELGKHQGSVRVMEDNAGCVQSAHGFKDSAKANHFKRTQTYVENKCGQGIVWLDDVPGTENWADIFTKSVAPIEQFEKLRDIVMGVRPDKYVSPVMRDALMKRETWGVNKLLDDMDRWQSVDGPEDWRTPETRAGA